MNARGNISERQRGGGEERERKRECFIWNKSDNSSYKMLVSKLNTVISNINTNTYRFIKPFNLSPIHHFTTAYQMFWGFLYSMLKYNFTSHAVNLHLLSCRLIILMFFCSYFCIEFLAYYFLIWLIHIFPVTPNTSTSITSVCVQHNICTKHKLNDLLLDPCQNVQCLSQISRGVRVSSERNGNFCALLTSKCLLSTCLVIVCLKHATVGVVGEIIYIVLYNWPNVT